MATLSYIPTRRRWRVRFRATNRVSRQVLSGSRCFLEKGQAARFWCEMEAQENLWRTGSPELAHSLSESLIQFARYCTRHTRRTQEHYARVLAAFRAGLPPTTQRVQQIDQAGIEEYLYRLHDKGLVNRTLNSHLTAIKAFCRWFSRRARLPNPAAEVAMLVQDPPHSRFLAPEEHSALLDHADPVNRDRITFLANTGLRASEFSELVRSGRLNPAATAVTVRGKGRKMRTVPLNSACRDCLTRPHIYLPIGRNALFQAISKIARAASIPSLGPHALRHWFATRMLIRGVPIAVVAKILGHSVRVCETTYAHILPQDVAAATAVLDDSAAPL